MAEPLSRALAGVSANAIAVNGAGRQVAHYDEQGIHDAPAPEDDAKLTKLIGWYEASEQASSDTRAKQERDRDYVDNKQLTDAEIRKLEERGQPAIVLNVIRSRASFLSGMEKKQRRDPKAYPRNNPNDIQAAEAFTDGMRYVIDTADYPSQRSSAFRNISVEGFGGVEIAAKEKRGGVEITIDHMPWDRLFYDPHSSKPDFSDARYLGMVLWMDYDDAVERALAGGQIDEEEAKRILDTTMARASDKGNTYDDKPKWQVWAMANRKRVRIVQMWYVERGEWAYCEFTQAGFLLQSPAPYVDQDGDSYCPWIVESANVDRDNNRYGEIRHLIDPQDEVNKRRSKALHQAVSRGVIADAGAVEDVNKVRRELTKPDFYIEVSPMTERFEIVDGIQLAAGQAQLLQEAMAYIMQSGPNAALLGKGVEDQSGRAIEAQQAGGMVEQSDIMDVLRRFDWRVFRVVASMMKQFWDKRMWIRVTDDDEAPRWVGLNEPMWTEIETGRTMPESEWEKLYNADEPFGEVEPAVDPETGEPILNNHVARLDMDIIVSDAPDTITLDGENYKALLDLFARGLPPPILKLAIELHPGLNAKRKKSLIDTIEQLSAPAEKPPEVARIEQLKIEDAEATIAKTRSETYKNLATGEKTMVEAHGLPAAEPPRPDVIDGMTDAGGPGPQPQPEPPMLEPEMGPPPQAEPPPGPPGPPEAPQGAGALMMA